MMQVGGFYLNYATQKHKFNKSLPLAMRCLYDSSPIHLLLDEVLMPPGNLLKEVRKQERLHWPGESVVQWLEFLLLVHEVPGSNPGWGKIAGIFTLGLKCLNLIGSRGLITDSNKSALKSIFPLITKNRKPMKRVYKRFIKYLWAGPDCF